MKKCEKYGIFVHPGKELTTPRWKVKTISFHGSHIQSF